MPVAVTNSTINIILLLLLLIPLYRILNIVVPCYISMIVNYFMKVITYLGTSVIDGGRALTLKYRPMVHGYKYGLQPHQSDRTFPIPLAVCG